MKIKELQLRYGLKTRQSIYDWIKAANLILSKDERNHAYASPEQIEILDQLSTHLKNGGILSNFTPLSSPEIYTPMDGQTDTPIDTSEHLTVYPTLDTPNQSIELLERLVGAIAANLQPRSPIWFHDELEKALERGWILSSSEVRELIGVKPSGETFQRGGWIFIRSGKIGSQSGWKVKRA